LRASSAGADLAPGRDLRRPTIGLAVAPAAVFLLLSTLVTVGGTAAGILLPAAWFFRMTRRGGLRVRFAPAETAAG
jgi:hypothetical protein